MWRGSFTLSSAAMPIAPPPATLPPIERLIRVMAALRNPEGGCPWDLEQNFSTIAPYTIEEAYEVAHEIETGDRKALAEELGDLLLQVVYHSRMAEEEGSFDFQAVATGITEKMIRRHPHVFGADAPVANAGDQSVRWEALKAAERAGKPARSGILDAVTPALPGLTRAVKLTARAARVGFDWTRAEEILDKLAEETDELRAELAVAERDPDRIEDEMGDMLFVLANLARRLSVDPEAALRRANAKFTRRFNHIEATLAGEGRTPDQATLAEMEDLWVAAKRLERE